MPVGDAPDAPAAPPPELLEQPRWHRNYTALLRYAVLAFFALYLLSRVSELFSEGDAGVWLVLAIGVGWELLKFAGLIAIIGFAVRFVLLAYKALKKYTAD